MYYIYILASQKNGTLYIGVTENLLKRIHEHKQKTHNKCFSAKYSVTDLVYFEETSDVLEALKREKQLKNWKIELIEKKNPDWSDLYKMLLV